MSSFKWIGLIVGCVISGYAYARHEEKRHNNKKLYSGTIHIITNDDGEKELYLDLDTTIEDFTSRKEVIFKIANN